MPLLSILFVGHNSEFWDAAARFLAMEPSLRVIGRAHSGSEVLAQVNQLEPHLVLLDWAMPDMHGLEVTRQIKGRSIPAAERMPHVILLGMHDMPQYRVEAAAAGADGFLCKKDIGVELLPLISALRVEALRNDVDMMLHRASEVEVIDHEA